MVLESLRNLSRKQWLTLFVFAVADFCSAICVSLQAPFYPHEAERKGATATEYGLVFGIFELTVFIVSPLIGKNLSRCGAKRVFNIGILTTGTCSILFGCLDKVENCNWFIGLSFVIRIIEAVGNSGFLTASFSIIAKEFPDQVAFMFACLETFFGIGLIVGPSVGGALYQAGGYTLPFAVLGGLLICAAIMTHFVLPARFDEEQDGEDHNNTGMLDLLKVPRILFSAYSILCASVTIGYIQATLEPHLRQFGLSPVSIGLMFVVNGGCYAVTAPIWGIICDRKWSPVVVTSIGAFLITTAFTFMGPAPFIPLTTTLGLVVSTLIIHGVGFAAQLVAGFSMAHREALRSGFDDNLKTYSLVSGLWTSTFALGAFIGPSVAGLLVDHFSFAIASLFVVALQSSVFAITLAFYCRHRRQQSKKKAQGYVEIGSNDDEIPFGNNRFDSNDNPTVLVDNESTYSDAIEATDLQDLMTQSRKSPRYNQQRLTLPGNAGDLHGPRQRQRRGFATNASSSGRGSFTETIFSPSPLDHCPVNLLSGYMGISVPTTTMYDMDTLIDDSLAVVNNGRRRSRSENQPLRLAQSDKNYQSYDGQPRILVTAIVEENNSSDRRLKDVSGIA